MWHVGSGQKRLTLATTVKSPQQQKRSAPWVPRSQTNTLVLWVAGLSFFLIAIFDTLPDCPARSQMTVFNRFVVIALAMASLASAGKAPEVTCVDFTGKWKGLNQAVVTPSEAGSETVRVVEFETDGNVFTLSQQDCHLVIRHTAYQPGTQEPTLQWSAGFVKGNKGTATEHPDGLAGQEFTYQLEMTGKNTMLLQYSGVDLDIERAEGTWPPATAGYGIMTRYDKSDAPIQWTGPS